MTIYIRGRGKVKCARERRAHVRARTHKKKSAKKIAVMVAIAHAPRGPKGRGDGILLSDMLGVR